MAPNKVKAPTAANGGASEISDHGQAIYDFEIITPLAKTQEIFIARRTRLAPARARLIAELAFQRRAA